MMLLLSLFSVSINNDTYTIIGEIVRNALNLLLNSIDREANQNEVVRLLNDISYDGDNSNLGKFYRKCMRTEWSFFCNSIIKVFSGKVSNFDAFTMSML